MRRDTEKQETTRRGEDRRRVTAVVGHPSTVRKVLVVGRQNQPCPESGKGYMGKRVLTTRKEYRSSIQAAAEGGREKTVIKR
jgi:hypothetical protein